VVLIDPSYELKTEYREVFDCLEAAYRRWATGVYLVWYPLLAREPADKLLKRIVASGMRRVLNIELALTAPARDSGLWGSGLVIINPPYQLAEEMRSVLPWLQRVLHASTDAGGHVQWLVPE
jgi:23S rRNA (adenine2030-N6)-methyltransferase